MLERAGGLSLGGRKPAAFTSSLSLFLDPVSDLVVIRAVPHTPAVLHNINQVRSQGSGCFCILVDSALGHHEHASQHFGCGRHVSYLVLADLTDQIQGS